MCDFNILSTMKITSILLWLVTNGFHVAYESVFFTTRLKMLITRLICFCFHPSRQAVAWYHRYLTLAVIKLSFFQKDL